MGSINRKIFVITGASSGIGYEAALAFSKLSAEVILICKNKEKGQQAKQKIIADSGNSHIHLFIADLSSQSQIRKVAMEISSAFDKIDVLINNAAILSSIFQSTCDQIELQFAVNYLAPFLLTQELLPLIQKSDQGRIINVASRSHLLGYINFDNLFFAKKYSGSLAYNQSKLALVMFTYNLANRLRDTNITVNCMNPGLVNTSFGHKNTPFWYSLFWLFYKQLGKSPAKGIETIIYLAISDHVTHLSGQYFGNKKPIKSSTNSYHQSASVRLWELSVKLTSNNI
jgi:NAD(P)-dependent dehydrogenase (short-subunit alcohol dehydrogenase family)